MCRTIHERPVGLDFRFPPFSPLIVQSSTASPCHLSWRRYGTVSDMQEKFFRETRGSRFAMWREQPFIPCPCLWSSVRLKRRIRETARCQPAAIPKLSGCSRKAIRQVMFNSPIFGPLPGPRGKLRRGEYQEGKVADQTLNSANQRTRALRGSGQQERRSHHFQPTIFCARQRVLFHRKGGNRQALCSKWCSEDRSGLEAGSKRNDRFEPSLALTKSRVASCAYG